MSARNVLQRKRGHLLCSVQRMAPPHPLLRLTSLPQTWPAACPPACPATAAVQPTHCASDSVIPPAHCSVHQPPPSLALQAWTTTCAPGCRRQTRTSTMATAAELAHRGAEPSRSRGEQPRQQQRLRGACAYNSRHASGGAAAPRPAPPFQALQRFEHAHRDTETARERCTHDAMPCVSQPCTPTSFSRFCICCPQSAHPPTLIHALSP